VPLRRALLLFAIVLGLSALAASVSRTDRSRQDERVPAPAPKTDTDEAAPSTITTPAPDPATRRLRFVRGGAREVRALPVGRAGTVVVETDARGQAEIRGLGLTRAAVPGTPATFDVFRTVPASFPVLFRTAAGGESERLGTLRFVPKRRPG